MVNIESLYVYIIPSSTLNRKIAYYILIMHKYISVHSWFIQTSKKSGK